MIKETFEKDLTDDSKLTHLLTYDIYLDGVIGEVGLTLVGFGEIDVSIPASKPFNAALLDKLRVELIEKLVNVYKNPVIKFTGIHRVWG